MCGCQGEVGAATGIKRRGGRGVKKRAQILRIEERGKGAAEDCVRWSDEEFMKCDDLWRASRGTNRGRDD